MVREGTSCAFLRGERVKADRSCSDVPPSLEKNDLVRILPARNHKRRSRVATPAVTLVTFPSRVERH